MWGRHAKKLAVYEGVNADHITSGYRTELRAEVRKVLRRNAARLGSLRRFEATVEAVDERGLWRLWTVWTI